jgi:hypothetical protein
MTDRSACPGGQTHWFLALANWLATLPRAMAHCQKMVPRACSAVTPSVGSSMKMLRTAGALVAAS